MMTFATTFLLLAALCSGANAFAPTSRPTLRVNHAVRALPIVLEETEQTAVDVDVSMAAEDIKATAPYKAMTSLERVSAADPQLPDGKIPVNINLDIRWFIFLGLFCAGEDYIMDISEPVRALSVFGVHPFDAIISSLAGPVVRASDGEVGGLHELPTGGLLICLAYFAHYKGWTGDATRALKRRLQLWRDRDRV